MKGLGFSTETDRLHDDAMMPMHDDAIRKYRRKSFQICQFLRRMTRNLVSLHGTPASCKIRALGPSSLQYNVQEQATILQVTAKRCACSMLQGRHIGEAAAEYKRTLFSSCSTHPRTKKLCNRVPNKTGLNFITKLPHRNESFSYPSSQLKAGVQSKP